MNIPELNAFYKRLYMYIYKPFRMYSPFEYCASYGINFNAFKLYYVNFLLSKIRVKLLISLKYSNDKCNIYIH